MVANKLITLTSNIFSNLNLTDIETGYKLFKSNILKDIKFTENKFRIWNYHKIANFKPKLKIFEVGIIIKEEYIRRKNRSQRCFAVLFCIIKYGLFKIN